MKFYIAGRVKKKKEVEKIHKLLSSKGHEFTSDWIEEGNILPYSENIEKSSSLVERCMKNINKSDVFVLLSDETGTGMYTELGIALQLATEKNKPKIYIIGEYRERSAFFFHPLVKRVKEIEQVFSDLEI